MSGKKRQNANEIVDQKKSLNHSMMYEIRVKGHLTLDWTDWFEGLVITQENNSDTLISGPVMDQTALHGLLKKVRDLGVPLISVIQVHPTQVDTSETIPLNSLS